jgi:ribose-phosphate pyrophosphokinase
MIKINGEEVKIERFYDGTPRIKIDTDYSDARSVELTWDYENDSELASLLMINGHLREHGVERIFLNMPYLPNARMDRTENDEEVFTLKYFCNFINSLKFNGVCIYDAHSRVGTALIDRVIDMTPKNFIIQTLIKIGAIDESYQIIDDNFILYFPDAGAAKRYSGMFPTIPFAYGDKDRDWKTGKILGTIVRDNGIDLKGKNILIIDDICSKGGTFYYSAKKLKELGVHTINLFATHCENIVLEGQILDSGLIEKLYTVDTIFNKEHPKIEVLPF